MPRSPRRRFPESAAGSSATASRSPRSPMIDSSSIGNSDDQTLARHRPAADAFEPHRAAEALAQHLHQAGAEPIAGFLGRDQEYVSRDVGCGSRRRHAARPVTKRPAASAASIMACGSTTIVLPATIAIPASLGRGRALDGPRPHGREIEPQILAALGRLHQHAARRRWRESGLPRAAAPPAPAARRCPRCPPPRPHDRRSR